MSNLRIISVDEVAEHNTEDSCWIIINQKVYDVTKFVDEHPGGAEVISRLAGTDVSTDFDDVGHSKDAMVMAEEYLIGQLPGTEVKESEKDSVKDTTSSWFSGILSSFR